MTVKIYILFPSGQTWLVYGAASVSLYLAAARHLCVDKHADIMENSEGRWITFHVPIPFLSMHY